MAHIQSFSGNVASGTSNSFTLTSTISNHSGWVGQVFLENATNIITSITDDKSNTYTLLDAKQDGSSAFWVQSFALANITNAPKTITIHCSAVPTGVALYMWGDEYGNISSIDAHNMTYTASATSFPSGSLTLSNTNDVIWTGTAPDSGTATIPSGYTQRVNDTGNGLFSADFVESSSGSYAGASWTNGTATNAVVGIVALSPLNTFTASLSESGSAADTVTVIAIASLSESGSATDNPSVVAIASLSESGSAADSPTVHSFLATFTLSEAGSASDSPSGLMTASWTIAESGSAADNLSIPYIASLIEAGNAIDTLTFTLLAPPAPPAPYGIYQPKDLQHAIQWWFQAQQALQQALQNGDPSQIPQLMRQIRRWVGMINALRLAQAYGVKSEATRQKLMYCAPIWPNQGEN